MRLKHRIGKWLHGKAFYRRNKEAPEAPLSRDVLSLSGKRAAVFGVATDRSIAWSIAKTLDAFGCRVAIGYQARAEEYVRALTPQLRDPLVKSCELTDDAQIDAFFEELRSGFGSIDFLIHSVAYAKKEFLQGKYCSIDRKGFLLAHEVSVWSLTALARAAQPLLNDGGRIITLSYLGSQRAVPN